MEQRSPRFVTTRWSVVLAARDREDPAAGAALSDLCEAYWYPLYAFLRRGGAARDDALDTVQGFLVSVLQRGQIGASPDRGRFRSYLLGALKHYAANMRRAERTTARGSGDAPVSLDDAEERYAREPADHVTPAALFEKRWATVMLERVLARLEEEYAERGRSRAFEVLKDALTGSAEESYSEKAEALGVSESAVKVGVHRMRSRMRELVREEIAQTVDDPAAIDDELGLLFEALSD